MSSVPRVAQISKAGDCGFSKVKTAVSPTWTTNPAASSAPADGPTADNHVHANNYPNTASPGQPKECEAGNEPFLVGRKVIGNVPGTQPATTEGTK